jgi:c-di-GMP-binding flagellar brake protein YcgR
MQPERRRHVRLKVRVPVELQPEGSDVPMRTETTDLSEGGCYVEMRFTFASGTKLELTLQIDGTLLASATVVTSQANTEERRAQSDQIGPCHPSARSEERS